MGRRVDPEKEFEQYASNFIRPQHLRRDMLQHARLTSREITRKLVSREAELLRASNWTKYQIIAYLTNLYQIMYGEDICVVAAEHGDLPFIKLLVDHQYTFSYEEIAKSASFSGHVDVLQWVFDHTGEVYPSSYRTADFAGRRDVIDYLNKLQDFKRSSPEFAELEELHQRGVCWRKSTFIPT